MTATSPESARGGCATFGAVTLVRRARTSDVRAIRDLVEPLTATRVLVAKDAVAYYEGLQQFRVAEVDGAGRGLRGAARAVGGPGRGAHPRRHEDAVGRGIGGQLLEVLLADARDLGIDRVFCLTFEVDFFTRHGFSPIEGQAVPPEVYAELLRSYDEGVAEFLDLERVKPNTLGNTRMLRTL